MSILENKICYLFYLPMHNNSACFSILEKELKNYFEVSRVTPEEIIYRSLPQPFLFVIPGGADSPYHDCLKGIGNQKIKKWVESGSNYLGICAGAYYGCSKVLFDVNGPLEIIAERELKFCKGTAIGPVFPGFKYDSIEGAHNIIVIWANGKKTKEYFNGGCTFIEIGSNTKILGYYHNYKPAVIKTFYGKGCAILSGIHIELNGINFKKILYNF